ncbi:MAG TPA: shikimate kinase [Desulfobacteria bacterium]|nr:shikimate kinase [Desulfobacteria bacterium]
MGNWDSPQNIVLIGFMGTGKSSVGKKLAQRLGLRLIDTDTEIESSTGLTIPEIFQRDGVVRFRSEESLVVKKAASWRGVVISTGGGAVLNPENLAVLRRSGIIVTLTASPAVICARTIRKGNRPLLKDDNSPEKIQKLLAERDYAYRQGDLIIDTSDKSLDEVVQTIIEFLEEKRYGKN